MAQSEDMKAAYTKITQRLADLEKRKIMAQAQLEQTKKEMAKLMAAISAEGIDPKQLKPELERLQEEFWQNLRALESQVENLEKVLGK